MFVRPRRCLIGGCFLLVNKSTKDAQKVSDEFVTAVRPATPPKPMADGPMRSARQRARPTPPQFVKSISALRQQGRRLAQRQVDQPSTDSGKIAVFTYKLKAAKGDGSVYFKTQIRDEQGRWQVMNFRSAETALNTDVE